MSLLLQKRAFHRMTVTTLLFWICVRGAKLMTGFVYGDTCPGQGLCMGRYAHDSV